MLTKGIWRTIDYDDYEDIENDERENDEIENDEIEMMKLIMRQWINYYLVVTIALETCNGMLDKPNIRK